MLAPAERAALLAELAKPAPVAARLALINQALAAPVPPPVPLPVPAPVPLPLPAPVPLPVPPPVPLPAP